MSFLVSVLFPSWVLLVSAFLCCPCSCACFAASSSDVFVLSGVISWSSIGMSFVFCDVYLGLDLYLLSPSAVW